MPMNGLQRCLSCTLPDPTLIVFILSWAPLVEAHLLIYLDQTLTMILGATPRELVQCLLNSNLRNEFAAPLHQ
jgi:hypothetical protein